MSDIKKDDGCCTYLLSTTHTQLHISPVYGKKSSCSQGFFQNKSCKFSPKPFSFTTWLHFYCLVATDEKYQKIFCQCHLEQALLSGLTHNIILPIMHTQHTWWGKAINNSQVTMSIAPYVKSYTTNRRTFWQLCYKGEACCFQKLEIRHEQ